MKNYLRLSVSIAVALNIVLLFIIAALVANMFRPVPRLSKESQSQLQRLQSVVDSYREQEALNIAFDKLMFRPPSSIRDVKYLWQLAPFVGKDVEIFGISKDERVKNADRFVINGNEDIIIYGCDQAVALSKQGVNFSEHGEYIVSDGYLLLRGKLCFQMFTEESLKEIRESGDAFFPKPISLRLTDLEVVKVYKTLPSPQERPDSIRLAIPSARCKRDFNGRFLGLVGNVNLMPLLRFIASLEKQDPEKAKEIFQKQSKQNYNELSSVNNMLELVPFLGSSVEIKGRLEKSKDAAYGKSFESSLIINENNKLSLSINIMENDNHRFGQSVVCRGKLCFGCGEIYLAGVEYVDEAHVQDDDIVIQWVIRKVPDSYVVSEDKESFFTGFHGDANYIVFRSYITELMKRYPLKKDKE